ncbi:MAG TPA: hypothetical protein PLV52_01575 [Candidatus Omnitrophota bacterium]|nr:hypothetical protein [Candidatus Omnitrophota bacterium]
MMFRKTVFFLLIAAVLFSAQLSFAEKLQLKFDERSWHLGYNAQDESQGLREYVLKGETVENWGELITAQAFFGLQKKVNADAYASSMLMTLKKACPDLVWKSISKASDDILMEWEIKDCPGQPDQYEVDRIISGSEAVYVIHYATKRLPVSDEMRSKWLDIMSKVKLLKS